MNRLKMMLGCIALLAQPLAHGLEPSKSVTATTILKTQSSWDGTPLTYPQGQAEITGMLIEIAPYSETGWHLHPVPSFGMILEGELEIRLKDGQTKRLKAGDPISEVVNTLHNGRNLGAIPVKILVFYTGVADHSLTVKEDAASALKTVQDKPAGAKK